MLGIQVPSGVYGDLIIVYPKPYSIYLRGAITTESLGFRDFGTPGPRPNHLGIWMLRAPFPVTRKARIRAAPTKSHTNGLRPEDKEKRGASKKGSPQRGFPKVGGAFLGSQY